MLALGLVGTAALIVIAAIGGAIGVTLFFRRNPKKQDVVNNVVTDVGKKIS